MFGPRPKTSDESKASTAIEKKLTELFRLNGEFMRHLKKYDASKTDDIPSLRYFSCSMCNCDYDTMPLHAEEITTAVHRLVGDDPRGQALLGIAVAMKHKVDEVVLCHDVVRCMATVS